MGVTFSEMNFDGVMNDLGKACLKCQGCEGTNCLVGFSKACVTTCLRENITYVENGMERIPHDIKLFHEEIMLEAIANILRQCKSCKQDHFDNCIVNVIRSCYEVAVFGDHIAYEGSTLQYLNQLHTQQPQFAEQIAAYFQGSK